MAQIRPKFIDLIFPPFHHPTVTGLSHFDHFTLFGNLFLLFKSFYCVCCEQNPNILQCKDQWYDLLKLCWFQFKRSFWSLNAKTLLTQPCDLDIMKVNMHTGPFAVQIHRWPPCQMRSLFYCSYVMMLTYAHDLLHLVHTVYIILYLFTIVFCIIYLLDGNAGIRSGWGSQS